MWRLTLAVLAAIWVNTALLSAQSSVSAFYRLLNYLKLQSAPPSAQHRPTVAIPRTWDDQAVASLEVPLAVASASPVHIPSTYYYGIPVRPIYKSYAVYYPSKEPSGYIDWLKRQEPQVAFDATNLNTPADWMAAGELVFDAPVGYGHIAAFGSDLYLRDPSWYQETGAPLARDGTLPFYRYVIRKKGKIEIGLFSCGMCHTRVMPDGSVVKGAQGNFPFDRAGAWDAKQASIFMAPVNNFIARRFDRALFATPWIKPDPFPELGKLSARGIAARNAAIPPGVNARHGTSPYTPAKVPDLIGIQERRYLDATGLVRHREIGDLMRYERTRTLLSEPPGHDGGSGRYDTDVPQRDAGQSFPAPAPAVSAVIRRRSRGATLSGPQTPGRAAERAPRRDQLVRGITASRARSGSTGPLNSSG